MNVKERAVAINTVQKTKFYRKKIFKKKKNVHKKKSFCSYLIKLVLLGGGGVFIWNNLSTYEEKPIYILSNSKNIEESDLIDYLRDNKFFEKKSQNYLLGYNHRRFKDYKTIEDIELNTQFSSSFSKKETDHIEDNFENSKNIDKKSFSRFNSDNILTKNKISLNLFKEEDYFDKIYQGNYNKRNDIIRIHRENNDINIFNEELLFENTDNCKKINAIISNNNGCYILKSLENITIKKFFKNNFNSRKIRSLLSDTNNNQYYNTTLPDSNNNQHHNMTDEDTCVYVKHIMELPRPEGMSCAYFIGVVWVGDYVIRYPLMFVGACIICCILRCIVGQCNHRAYENIGDTIIILDDNGIENIFDSDETDESGDSDSSSISFGVSISKNSNQNDSDAI